MDFEFKGTFYVEEYYLEEMVKECRKGATPYEAFDSIVCGWDDCDYFIADYIADDVVKEIEKRLGEEK